MADSEDEGIVLDARFDSDLAATSSIAYQSFFKLIRMFWKTPSMISCAPVHSLKMLVEKLLRYEREFKLIYDSDEE